MSEARRGVILTHGTLATALRDAVAGIAGSAETLIPVSNEGCDRQAIYDRVVAALGDEPGVVFVDLPGGSCFSAAARLRRDRPDLKVIAGVNLPMLVDFVLNRGETLDDVVAHAVEAGTRAIGVTTP